MNSADAAFDIAADGPFNGCVQNGGSYQVGEVVPRQNNGCLTSCICLAGGVIGRCTGACPTDASGPGDCAWTLVETGFNSPTVGMFWDGPGQRLVSVERDRDSALTLLPSPVRVALNPAGTRPPLDMQTASMVYRVASRQVLVFGATADGSAGGLYSLSLDPAPMWSAVATVGTPPQPRVSAVLALDAAQNRLFLSGGIRYPQTLHDSQVLALDAPSPQAWSIINTGASFADEIEPPQGAVWDPVQGRLLARLYSGRLWALPLDAAPAWAEIVVSPALPLLRTQFGEKSDFYDPIGHALLVAGGLSTSSGAPAGEQFVVHLFRLPLDGATAGGFTEIAVANRPQATTTASNNPLAYDPVQDRLFLQIDGTFAGLPSAIWSLPLAACR